MSFCVSRLETDFFKNHQSFWFVQFLLNKVSVLLLTKVILEFGSHLQAVLLQNRALAKYM